MKSTWKADFTYSPSAENKARFGDYFSKSKWIKSSINEAFDLDFGRVMGGGGGVIGPSAMAIKRAVSIGGASQRRKVALAGASILLPHFAVYLWTFQGKKRIFFAMSKGKITEAEKSEVLQGTLDLMAPKVLDAPGPLHGYGIARRIDQVLVYKLRARSERRLT